MYSIIIIHVMSYSCERTRTKAYNDDVRWRIVWQAMGLNFSVSKIAANLCVDESTVHRIINKFQETGEVQKKIYPLDKAYRKLTEPAQLFILQLVVEHPVVYLREIKSELLSELGVDVTVSAICKFLHKSGFMKQKAKMHAIQRDEALRSKFALDVSLYSREMLVFIDETGTDRRDCIRRRGYSLRGRTPIVQNLLARGEHVSAICSMSVDGMLACKLVRGGVDGDAFLDFVENELMPTLMPFDGYNPRSVVIMDNCSIHHIDEVTELIQQTGAIVHWLPPYSPDYNPIEELFSKSKAMMKAMETEMETIDDIDTIIYAAFSMITSSDCEGWVSDSGIYY